MKKKLLLSGYKRKIKESCWFADSKRAPLPKRKLTSVAAMISALRPIMDLAEPILKAKPEVCEESHLDNW